MHRILLLVLGVIALALAACGDDDPSAGTAAGDDEGAASLTVYSGRNGGLIGPLIDRYEEQTGTNLEVRFGDSAELAATILEEGSNSPADLFFSQDAGALGALQDEGRLAALPAEILERVEPAYRSQEGRWVGTSGRARVIAYDNRELSEADLPPSILDFAEDEWGGGRMGWAPTNASLQAFVTALRVERGDDVARAFIEGLQDNDIEAYENNIAIRDAIANGEIDVGFINHYYVAEAIAEEGEDYPVGIYFPPGDLGSLINVAGVGLVEGTEREEAALDFVRYLLGEEGQTFFAQETKEYPLSAGVRADPMLTPLDEIDAPAFDLSRLDDLQGTVELLQETGAL